MPKESENDGDFSHGVIGIIPDRRVQLYCEGRAFFAHSAREPAMRAIPVVLVLCFVAIVPGPESQGCAMAPPRGSHVGVNSEKAIILYDAETGTEHFIRRADFRTEVKDFGFLVPTPSRPELGETESWVFDRLQQTTAPRHLPSGRTQRIVQKRSMGESKAPMSAAPRVLETKKVAGYDAVVLQADDIDGLKKWLEDNKYDARPAVMEWLKWYVDNRWIITAFKVSLDARAASDRWSKSVRMSFETKTPFYPYREPEDARLPDPKSAEQHPRHLRIFFLSDARYQGTLGRDGVWPGKTVWSNVCPKTNLAQVIQGLGMPQKENEAMAAKTWHLTEFEDGSSPRPGTEELYFKRAEDQSTIERPVIYYDQYEFVYEDEPKPMEKFKDEGNSKTVLSTLLLFVPAGFALLVLAVVLILVLRKR